MSEKWKDVRDSTTSSNLEKNSEKAETVEVPRQESTSSNSSSNSSSTSKELFDTLNDKK